jgi:hypothetical protein
MDQSSPSQGEAEGVPTAAAPALVVDLATLTVSAGPSNPTVISTVADASGGRFVTGQFRLTASVVAFTVNGVHLTTGGSGDWAGNVARIEVYNDNGNGVSDDSDFLLYSGAPTTPGLDCVFAAGVNVAPGAPADLWIVVNTLSTAGANPVETFIISIADAADVMVSAHVLLGAALPVSGTLRVIDFAVTEFAPLRSGLKGGDEITVRGTGFAWPVTLTIGGVACAGTASVNAAGTEIKGLKVPEWSGEGVEIVLETNGLSPITLPQTFTYSTIRDPDDNPAQSEGCAVGVPAAPFAALFPGLLGVLALRRRAGASRASQR